eukprot:TRINITY_DN3376_c0_g1_i1.p1 TRINITY_DN3376_c0_g1~~TRINITY_DN3376_c0_g1_i1.p1  ORF type:complete len:116 (+),score=9.52 TRINITY_DN3376_c0_g1_i1:54-401(+)
MQILSNQYSLSCQIKRVKQLPAFLSLLPRQVQIQSSPHPAKALPSTPILCPMNVCAPILFSHGYDANAHDESVHDDANDDHDDVRDDDHENDHDHGINLQANHENVQFLHAELYR